MVDRPSLPGGGRPFPYRLLVVDDRLDAGYVCDGYRAERLRWLQPGVGMFFIGGGEHRGIRLFGGEPLLQKQMQTHQMDADGLDASPAWTARMLDGVGVYGETMNVKVHRVAVLTRKNIAKSGPAPGRRFHIGMRRTRSVREAGSATWASCHRHLE